jgi:PAS domain S-box-containing protein
VHVSLSISPIKSAADRVVGAAVIARDITERMKMDAALRDSEEKFSRTFHSNPAMLILTTLDGKSVEFNQSYIDFIGFSREEMIGKSTVELKIFTAEERQILLDLAAQAGGTLHNCETSIHLGDGRIRQMLYSVELFSVGGVPHRLSTLLDITDRKRAEEELRQSEERYRALFENSRDAIYVHDLSGRYVSVNRAAEELLGYSRTEIVGRHYSNFVAPPDLKQVRTNLCRKLDDDRQTVYEVNILNRVGRRIPVEVSSRLIFERGVAVGVQGTARDITERKRTQEALRIYSQKLIAAQEAERQKIARELHDEIGQVLTAVRINLQTIERSRRTNEESWPLEESIAIVDEALGRVRELSIDLRPALLDDLGLSAALRWYVDRYAQRTGIIAEVLNGSDDDIRMPRDIEIACFRIAQEALTNVARHAQAVSVSVQLGRARDRLLLTVIDDGVGFDIAQLRKSQTAVSTLGLRGMEERALAVGGHIVFDSGQARGTRIRAVFPLK